MELLQEDSPSTPSQLHENVKIPKCSICDENSTGIHFGVEACAACSAFFRRTVVLGKIYTCLNAHNCKLRKKLVIGQLCRACRLRRCLKVGMDKEAVQHRRDAIGHYSEQYAAIKEKNQESIRSETSLDSSSRSSSSCPSAIVGENILEEILASYEDYQKRRKTFYCNNSLVTLFDPAKELECTEITDFRECMFQILRVEPRLCIEFIESIKSLKNIGCEEKAAIYSNFILKLQAIEEPYFTWKHGGLEEGNKFWMMQNRTYIVFDKVEYYFRNNMMRGLNLDAKTAKDLFIPSFQHGLEMVGEKMAALDLRKMEMIGLVGIVLLDPAIPHLSPKTRQFLHSLRSRLFANLIDLERKEWPSDPPEVRVGNLVLSLIPGIEVHSHQTRQNMHMLDIFELVPRRDQLFGEITGIRSPPP